MTELWTPEQAPLGARMLPEVIATARAWREPGNMRPYLKGLAHGGLVQVDQIQLDPQVETVRDVEATGFRDTLFPQEFPKIGIPEDVAIDGLMWVVVTNRLGFHRDLAINPAQKSRKRLDHSFNYWDGEDWTTVRLKPGMWNADVEWEAKWEQSEITQEETVAIKSVARQTRFMHEAAHLFGEDASMSLERLLLEISDDTEANELAGLGITGQNSFPSSNYGEVAPHLLFYSPAYQMLGKFMRIAAKIEHGDSTHLDSDALMAVNYHRASAPSDPELLEKGENVLFRNIHPPVPSDWLK